MKTYTLSARALPVQPEYDVIVAGGGPAGCAAAIAAAREGAKTLLVEGTGCLGGMATAGLLTCWCPFSDGEKIIYRGIAEAVFTASKAATPHVRPEALDWVPLEPEALKRIYDDLVTAAGVTLLFHTQVTAVDMAAPGEVAALLLANKNGLTAARARIFVDCTGDADVAAWAGAPFAKGDAASGEVQPSTHCFVLTNVDEYAYRNHALWRGGTASPIDQIQACGRYPLLKDKHFCNHLIAPRTIGFNAGHLWDVDGTDPASISRAMVVGRRLAKQLRDGLAEFAPAVFGNAFLAGTGMLMGIRESRRIAGDYELTLADYLARRTFPDEIARNSYPIDIHTAKHEVARANQGRVKAMERFENFKRGESHGIPYRCLTPKGLKNVVVAGRCISTDRLTQGSTRVMPVCLVTGEAAGLAAALAVSGGDVHAVDTKQLRSRLQAHGAYLP